MSRSLIPRSGCHQANAPSSVGWSSIQRLFCTRWGMTGGGGGRGMIVVATLRSLLSGEVGRLRHEARPLTSPSPA